MKKAPTALALVTVLAACGSPSSETSSASEASSSSEASGTDSSGSTGGGSTTGMTSSSSAASGGSTGAGGGSGAHPIGQVTDVEPSSECPGCRQLTVHDCPGIEDLTAILKVMEPSGPAKGTIFAHNGGGGTNFYGHPNLDTYVAAGFRIALVRWLSDWEQTQTAGILDGACRPATVMQWVFDNVHQGGTSAAFCGIGQSGGSGVLAYALAHYGMDQILDYAALSAGPPFGRIDYGCAPETYSGSLPSLCSGGSSISLALPPTNLDPWENTTTCGTGMPSSADLAKWAADSVVSPTANYAYPKTLVSFFDCMANPNGTTGGAYFYSQQITSQRDVTCYTACTGEELGSQGWSDYGAAVLDQCVPRHQ